MKAQLFFLLISVLLFAKCSPTTQITASAKMTDEEPRIYKKLAVVVLTPRESTRATLEEAIAIEFRKRGVKAISTFTMFPLANHADEIQLNLTEEERQARIRERITQRELDGLVIIALLSQEEETHYVNNAVSVGISAPTVMYDAPIYNQPMSGYYGYASAVVTKPGHLETSKNFFIEANMYNVDTEGLFYTAQIEVKNPKKIGEESERFATVLVDDVMKKKALSK
jgi:hypothetical protein